MSNNILIRIYSLLQTFPTAPSLCLWCRCFAAGLRVQNAINDLVIAFKRRQMWVFFYPTSTAMWQSITFTPQHASLDINQMFREVVPRIWKIHGFTGECIHVYAAGRLLPVLSTPSRLPPQTQHLTFWSLITHIPPTKQVNCISEGTIQGHLSCLVTGSTGTSVSTRSSVSTTCSDSGDDDSAGITTTGLMCSDRADARRKLGGFCKKHRWQF